MDLPNLSSLTLTQRESETGKSWAWDPGSYNVKFSIDMAIQDQIDGLERALGALSATNTDTLRHFDGGLGGSLPDLQMEPIKLLKTLSEYTIQRLYDNECSVPRIALPPTSSWSDRTKNDGPLLVAVAKMSVGVKRTFVPYPGYTEGADDDDDDDDDDDETDGNNGDDDTDDDKGNDRGRPSSSAMELEDDDDDEDDEEDEKDEKGDDGEDMDEAEEAEDAAEKREIRAEYSALWLALSSPRKKAIATRARLERALVSILDEIEKADVTSDSVAELDARIKKTARFIVDNRNDLTEPSIRDVRRVPPTNYYNPRLINSKRYIRWLKMHLVLFSSSDAGDSDVVVGVGYKLSPFRRSMKIPSAQPRALDAGLDGSFYSGQIQPIGSKLGPEGRIRSLAYDHIVPQSHLRSALLVKEFGDPRHLAFNSIFALGTENSKKADKFLPLTLDDTIWGEMTSSNTHAYRPSNLPLFGPERRLLAARAVCATYLSLILLEKGSDGHTEAGSRAGGFYSIGTRSQEAFDMATNAFLYKTALRRRESLTFERGLALLQWHFLQQPFNPFPEIAHNAHRNATETKKPMLEPLVFYFRQLLFARFANLDFLSTLMRMEAREEVEGIPGDGHALASSQEEAQARDALKAGLEKQRVAKRPRPQSADPKPVVLTRGEVERDPGKNFANPNLRPSANKV